MGEWYILNIGYCADCGVGHITTKNTESGKERRFKTSIRADGKLLLTELEDEPEEEDDNS